MSDKCSSCKQKNQCSSKDKCITLNENSKIKRVIAVMSGKGGVGKSTMTSLLGVALATRGHKVGILDADITGPSIPHLFGLSGQKAESKPEGIVPIRSREGVKVISLNLLVATDDEPVIWRGPVIAATVKQFWTKVFWGELDYLLVDLPPGTGDVPLTVMQNLPLDGIVMVSSPQSLVSMIVRKGIRMAKRLNTPVFGLVENMSYVECPDCGKLIKLFGESELKKVCTNHDIELLGCLPLDLEFIKHSDQGNLEYAYKTLQHIQRPVGEIIDKVIARMENVR